MDEKKAKKEKRKSEEAMGNHGTDGFAVRDEAQPEKQKKKKQKREETNNE